MALAIPQTATPRTAATATPMATAITVRATTARTRAKIPVRGMSRTRIVRSASWMVRLLRRRLVGSAGAGEDVATDLVAAW
jgi:hypothetical protein